MRISVFGLGYVGAISAACLARDGHEVIGVDVDENKLRLIERGLAPIIEEGVEALRPNVRASGWLQLLIGRALLRAGRAADAGAAARRAIELLDSTPSFRARALGLLGRALLAEGEVPRASEAVRAALEIVRTRGVLTRQTGLSLTHAETLLAEPHQGIADRGRAEAKAQLQLRAVDRRPGCELERDDCLAVCPWSQPGVSQRLSEKMLVRRNRET